MSEGFQFFAPFSGSASLIASKNADYALNLSKKYGNLSSMPVLKSLPSPGLSYSPDVDALPMDLSKGTREETSSKEVKNVRRRDKVEKNAPMTKDEQRKLIERLQEELKVEESKLLLLKLIKRSQLVFGHNVKNGTALVSLSSSSASHKTSSLSSRQSSSYAGDATQKGQLGQTTHKSSQLNFGSQSLASTTASLLNFSSTSAFNCSTSYSRSCTPQTRSTPSTTPGIESSAQRQAAAKLALRRQLEKTLVQIPPPKPLPPEMNFIPNANSGDFVALLGLEEVVKCILDGETRRRGEPVMEVKYIFNPFKCVQCSTDFTPVWKRDRPASKNVICEKCVTTNQKRALKQEYTNRLKSAFVKALQQEQEIERGLQSSSSMGSISPSSAMLTNQHSLSVSSFLNPSLTPNHHKNFLQGDSLHRLTSDLASMSPLFSLPPSFWSLQNFPLGLSSSAAAAQALSQQLLFPFPGVLPKTDMTHRQFLDLLPRKSRQLDGSPLLWRS